MESSAASILIKDVHEIYGRLFNHHPAISAEIKCFLREFTDQRTEENFKGFLNLYERVKEMTEVEMDQIKSRTAQNFPEVLASLDKALNASEKILEQSEEYHGNCEKSLSESLQNRQQIWTDYMVEVSKRKEEIDKVWDDKDAELRSYYLSLEEKL
ncbi:hypothetical protein CHUAL_002067 [Chamberlinius hualienensis]